MGVEIVDGDLSAAAELCVEVGLGVLPGEGRTLVAREAVEAGSHVLRERPLRVGGSREELAAQLADALRADPEALAPALGGGARASGSSDPACLAEAAVGTFGLEFLDGANVCFFRVIGLVNHACATSDEANCCLSVPFDAGSVDSDEEVALLAMRHIAPGEPLRMPYLCPFAPRTQLEELQRSHSFTCRCSTCRGGGPTWARALACCAACGATGCAASPLKHCGACKVVLYCSSVCQRQHRPLHRQTCGSSAQSSLSTGEEERAFFAAAEAEYDRVMVASDAAMTAASEALRKKQRFSGARQLDESLALARGFLARCAAGASGVQREPAFHAGGLRLAPGHPFVHYVRGNAVKQSLTRLALRQGLLASEPADGCGSLAVEARAHLEGCLGTAGAVLPHFHVELLSLLRDVADLQQLARSLLGLAADLEVCGRPDEGSITGEVSLEEVDCWASRTLELHRRTLDVYGESPGCGGSE
uniref:MYND-type domain-containing protein n=1 Tax=Alexandrium monilatum TaxID=311494 RepID=A0A7S4R7T5_9DINO